jgi:hypothetical protein
MTTFSQRSHRLLALVVGGLSVLLLLAVGCVGKSAPATNARAAGADRLAASAPSSRTPGPLASLAATKPVSPDQASNYVPRHRGVGSALKPDIDGAPVVPRGQGIEHYVAAFYAAVESKDWQKASTMVPPSEPGEGLRDFERRQQGYELGTVSIFPSATSEGKATAFVVLLTPKNGVWHVTWRFLETPRGIVVEDLTYARPNKAG